MRSAASETVAMPSAPSSSRVTSNFSCGWSWEEREEGEKEIVSFSPLFSVLFFRESILLSLSLFLQG